MKNRQGVDIHQTYLEHVQSIKPQISGSECHCVLLDSGMSKIVSHISRMCSLQNSHKLSSSGAEMKCLVDPLQPSNMLAHEEAGIQYLPKFKSEKY